MNSKGYPSYYHNYIELIPEGNALELLKWANLESIKTLALVTEEKANYSYEAGKWSIKEVIQHVMDTERIFSYRALSFARGETLALPGYDHDAYANNSLASYRSLKDLLEEWIRLRASTIDLFRSFSTTILEKKGNANGNDVSVNQLLHIIIGHELHHLKIIQEKYL